ncbi:MAG: S41 family peptidase [Flavobacteriales bacterium]
MMARILILVICLAYVSTTRAQNDLSADSKKLEIFLKNLDGLYVDSLETRALVEVGIRAMLEELDPHSIYMNEEQFTAANEPLAGKFNGIGIRYHLIDDTLTVLEVFEDSPAEKGKLRAGDQLIAIGKDILSGRGLSANEMSVFIKDEQKANQPFTVWRNHGREKLYTKLDRAEVKVSSVPAYFMFDKHTGYIRLDKFSSTSLNDFRSALDALNEQGMDNLIFDLRGNSGGYLNVAIKIVDEFLDDRKLIVYTEGLHHSKRETYATSGGRFLSGDLVVLIDERSASASEIVAGAIQDWDRGLIVGRRSFGKGLVQRTIEFDDGSAMRLTISRYYTPSGRSIQKPYDDGVSAYKRDLSIRMEHGEFYSADSIKLSESLVYYTPAKRKVYGGGGIMPDVFVPADSIFPNGFVADMVGRGLDYLVALQLVERHRDQIMTTYPNSTEFNDSYRLAGQHLLEVKRLLRLRGIEFTDDEFAAQLSEMEKTIKPVVARFAYGLNDFYMVNAHYDTSVGRALENVANNTFKELGLNQ